MKEAGYEDLVWDKVKTNYSGLEVVHKDSNKKLKFQNNRYSLKPKSVLILGWFFIWYVNFIDAWRFKLFSYASCRKNLLYFVIGISLQKRLS